jgi:hypothetical protein
MVRIWAGLRSQQYRNTAFGTLTCNGTGRYSSSKSSVKIPLVLTTAKRLEYFERKKPNAIFLPDSSNNDSSSDSDADQAPHLLRRKRYIRRKDRAVNSLATSLDPQNYDPIPPVKVHCT